MVRKWQAEYDNLSQQMDEGNAKKRIECVVRPLFHELEDIVCEWIADRRAKALIVRRADLQAFALAMALELHIQSITTLVGQLNSAIFHFFIGQTKWDMNCLEEVQAGRSY